MQQLKEKNISLLLNSRWQSTIVGGWGGKNLKQLIVVHKANTESKDAHVPLSASSLCSFILGPRPQNSASYIQGRSFPPLLT